MVEKTSNWESELWGYLSSGDGTQCPLYSRCQNRLRGDWCPNDNLDLITRLLDDRRFNIAKYTLTGGGIGGGECGRIFQLVERLAKKYLKRAGVHCPPVQAGIVSLADEQHSIEVHLVPLTAYHGSIWHPRGRWIIQLKGNDSSAMKRFTLFHEGFHILAHCRTMPVFRRRGAIQGSFNELVADYFAGCILMPREWTEEKWSEVEDLGRMAEIFDVPKSLMWIRSRELSLI